MVIDANIFIGIYWAKDANHSASRLWLARYLLATYILEAPVLLLGEVAGAIARRTGDSALGHAAVAQVQLVPRLTFQEHSRSSAALAAELAADLKLRGADAVYAATAAQLGVPLITWDKELHDRAAAHVTTYYPHEV